MKSDRDRRDFPHDGIWRNDSMEFDARRRTSASPLSSKLHGMLVAIIVNPRYGGWYERSICVWTWNRAREIRLTRTRRRFFSDRLDYNSSSPPSARLNYPAWTCSKDGSRVGSLEEKAYRRESWLEIGHACAQSSADERFSPTCGAWIPKCIFPVLAICEIADTLGYSRIFWACH